MSEIRKNNKKIEQRKCFFESKSYLWQYIIAAVLTSLIL